MTLGLVEEDRVVDGGSALERDPGIAEGDDAKIPATTPPAHGSGAMFYTIAARYDLLNRVLSFGLDRRWRKRTIAALELEGSSRILDLATGTADLALEAGRQLPGAHVDGVDPAEQMLSIGRTKIERRGLTDRIELQQGDAQNLGFPDAVFDAVTMAFGIRNVPDRPRALREMARVVRPGGRVAILELSDPRPGVLGWLSRFHIHVLVPMLGGLISGRSAYRYLERSIGAFPPAPDFARQIAAAGLEVLRVEPLTFGVCHLFVARRPT
jgi:demethylmenaquinone methyltransferase/2-methoxy-6-polyprenyl-1,4-benzoquinol methylase